MKCAIRTPSAVLIALLAGTQPAHAAWTGVKEEQIKANTYREVLYFDAPSKDDLE